MYAPAGLLLLASLLTITPGMGADQTSVGEVAPNACTAASTGGAITAPELEKIDKDLLLLDRQSAMVFISRVVEILQESRGNLNFCSIEVRLRALGANTRLLAIPLGELTGASNRYTLVYPFPLFPTHSPVPRFTIWVERGGEPAAERKLGHAGLTLRENQRNLNLTGVAIGADIHPDYTISKDAGVVPPENQTLALLESYREAGNLSDDYDPMLMYAIEPYIKNLPHKTQFSINDRYSPGTLQFFVIAQDPDRLLVGGRCNCQYLPHTSVIICDKELLKAIDNWLIYGRSDDRSPALLDVANQMSREFLFDWLVGHEIGHLAHGDDYSTLFQRTKTKLKSSEATPRSVHSYEAAADQFAVTNMPGRVRGTGYMAYSYMFQEAFAEAAAQAKVVRGKGPIVLSDPPFEHPDFLTRIVSLKKAAGYEDFVLEKLEKQLRTSETSGVEISSLCDLAAHEQKP